MALSPESGFVTTVYSLKKPTGDSRLFEASSYWHRIADEKKTETPFNKSELPLACSMRFASY
jgi:hypothetical protein